MAALLQKYGLAGSTIDGMSGAMQQEDQAPGFLDDLFSGISSIAQVALPFILPGVGSIVSAGIGAVNNLAPKGKLPTMDGNMKNFTPLNYAPTNYQRPISNYK
jgi:hypothetical protein